jgi:hypothetical protein
MATPALIIDGKVIVGFDRDGIERAISAAHTDQKT